MFWCTIAWKMWLQQPISHGNQISLNQIEFVFAMGYNTLAIPFAASVVFPYFALQLPSRAAGGAMTFSSISVVCSSLWFRRYMWSQLTDLLLNRVQKYQDLLNILPHHSCYRLYKSVWCTITNSYVMRWPLKSPLSNNPASNFIIQNINFVMFWRRADFQTLKSVNVIKCLV